MQCGLRPINTTGLKQINDNRNHHAFSCKAG
jgi:hypothetical protein